eukprot:m.80819 g.80819  ORF g.80819 m.80819 type:complete len:57 (+) comp12783_c0_seq3:245-415(+)
MYARRTPGGIAVGEKLRGNDIIKALAGKGVNILYNLEQELCTDIVVGNQLLVRLIF